MTIVDDRLGELVTVDGPDGSTATVALHGAHAVSWKTADGVERLFLSSLATSHNGSAIRGGIPVCFPQFAGLGPLPKHGFARTAKWAHRAGREFGLTVTPEDWPGWAHECELQLNVDLGPSTLAVTLSVSNTGATPLSFTGALHSYLACADIREVSVRGLAGRQIHNGGRVDGDIGFGDGMSDVDLSVLNPTGPVTVIENGQPAMVCAQTGFPDAVVWNIGDALGSGMKDLGPGEWKSYVCIEAAVIGQMVTVAPGATWSGRQILICC